MNLRELRVWHYRRALSATEAADGYPGQSGYARLREKQNRRLADFHLSAVAALDPHCEASVQNDHEQMPRPHSRKQKR